MGLTESALIPRAVRYTRRLILIWMALGLLSTSYNIYRNFLGPAVFDPSQPPSLPWMFVFLPLAMLCFNLVLATVTYSHLRHQPDRGWRWSGALCIYQFLALLPTILTLTVLVKIPPDDAPLYTQAPWRLVLSLGSVSLSLVCLLALFTAPIMRAFQLQPGHKGKAFLRVAGMGLLMFVASIVLSMLASAPAVILLD